MSDEKVFFRNRIRNSLPEAVFRKFIAIDSDFHKDHLHSAEDLSQTNLRSVLIGSERFESRQQLSSAIVYTKLLHKTYHVQNFSKVTFERHFPV